MHGFPEALPYRAKQKGAKKNNHACAKKKYKKEHWMTTMRFYPSSQGEEEGPSNKNWVFVCQHACAKRIVMVFQGKTIMHAWQIKDMCL